MIFKAFSLKLTFFLLLVSNIVLSNHNIEDVLVGPIYSFDSEDCTPGESCDDGNSCTENDRYDRWCNCSGTYQDEDNDGVCDAEDKCPGGDDNIDKNGDGTPDDCEEKEKICSECEEDSNGEITLCWIPTNKFNLKTIRGDCEFLHKFFDENGNLKGKSQCGPCDCAMIGDKDTDGDGICDGNDDCPDKPDDDKCGCDDQDSDGDGICDNDDICPDHDDNEDLDGDGTPDGCDICPENPDYKDEVGPCGCDDQDTDNDGICDSEDCLPEDDSLPTDPGTACDDNDENTENDVIQADGCSCLGTPIEECEISAVIDDIVCEDNGTPAYADDDTYSFTLTAELLSGDATEWEGSFSNAYLGAFAIGPMAFGDKIDIGPIPAGSFTPSNVSPPILIEGGLSIDIQVNAVGDFECYDSGTVDSPGTCACDDGDGDGICDEDDCLPDNPDLPSDMEIACDDGDPNTINDVYAIGSCECKGEVYVCPDGDADGVCDEDDICQGHPDNMDSDGDGVPDGCDECPDNEDKDTAGECGCDDKDSDNDGICDLQDCLPHSPGLPATFVISCDDGDPNTINDVYAIGSCECKGEPIDGCPDSDDDGVCDEDDVCPGYDDNNDFDNDGIPNKCDCAPDVPGLPSSFIISCDDGDPNTINDVYEIGSCECKGEPIDGCSDSDDDGVCDEDDVCPGYDDNNDFDNDGIPNKCDCAPDVPGLPSTFIISCDDGDPNTINDVYDIGSCECKGEPIDGCSDSDGDGICDEDDICEGYDDNIDSDDDDIPDGCDCKPNTPGLPSTFLISCDDGDPNTINDVYAIGSCECAGEPISCTDSDGDDVCDDDDICEGYDDNIDSDDDGTPDGCDQCPNNSDRVEEGPCGCDECPVDVCEELCSPSYANSEYEWIDKVSINALENESGDDSGYGDYRDMSISLGHGDSASLWMFPAFLEDVCELSLHIYADWNQDCDFEDEDELIAWHKTVSENGADIAIPEHAKEGDVTIRFMLHNGRIRSGCQDYIDGEVEDYTLSIFTRDTQSFKNSSKKISLKGTSAIRISPNPVSDKEFLFIENSNINNLKIGFKIFSIDGTLIQNSTLNSGMNRINTSTYSPGIYIVETSDGINTERQKIVIQN